MSVISITAHGGDSLKPWRGLIAVSEVFNTCITLVKKRKITYTLLMRKKIATLLVLTILTIPVASFAKEASFTQDDRDRIIRLEEGQKSLQKQIDNTGLFLQKQLNDIRTLMLWGFGILFGGMGMLIGFVMWDRRTALAPAIRKNAELEERLEKIEKILKERLFH